MIGTMSFIEAGACYESEQETASEERISPPSSSPSPEDEATPLTSELNNKITTTKTSKRRPLLRKEIQKRYRERQKLKKELDSGSATQIDGEVALLSAENRKMQEERIALLAGLHQASIITDFLKNCRLSNDAATASAAGSAAEVHFPFSPSNPTEVADALFNNVFHGYEPSEYLVHKYAQLPFDLLIERDKHHFSMVLDTMMAEWQSTYSTRDEVTMKLHKLFDTRRRISTVIAEEYPIMHKEIMSTALQPPPGSALGDLAVKAMKRVAGEMNLSDQQLESINHAWLEYNYAIESLNFDVELAKVSIHSLTSNQPTTTMVPVTAPGTAAPTITTNGTTTKIETRQHQAKEFLTLSNSVATLSNSSRRMSIAYTRLASAVLSSLDVIQLAKLFRGCRPYFPNHVQLCKFIIEDDSSLCSV